MIFTEDFLCHGSSVAFADSCWLQLKVVLAERRKNYTASISPGPAGPPPRGQPSLNLAPGNLAQCVMPSRCGQPESVIGLALISFFSCSDKGKISKKPIHPDSRVSAVATALAPGHSTYPGHRPESRACAAPAASRCRTRHSATDPAHQTAGAGLRAWSRRRERLQPQPPADDGGHRIIVCSVEKTRCPSARPGPRGVGSRSRISPIMITVRVLAENIAQNGGKGDVICGWTAI